MDRFTNRALCANDKDAAEKVLSFWCSVRRCLIELDMVAYRVASLGFGDGDVGYSLFKACSALNILEKQLLLLRRQFLGEVNECEVL